MPWMNHDNILLLVRPVDMSILFSWQRGKRRDWQEGLRMG